MNLIQLCLWLCKCLNFFLSFHIIVLIYHTFIFFCFLLFLQFSPNFFLTILKPSNSARTLVCFFFPAVTSPCHMPYWAHPGFSLKLLFDFLCWHPCLTLGYFSFCLSLSFSIFLETLYAVNFDVYRLWRHLYFCCVMNEFHYIWNSWFNS